VPGVVPAAHPLSVSPFGTRAVRPGKRILSDVMAPHREAGLGGRHLPNHGDFASHVGIADRRAIDDDDDDVSNGTGTGTGAGNAMSVDKYGHAVRRPLEDGAVLYPLGVFAPPDAAVISNTSLPDGVPLAAIQHEVPASQALLRGLPGLVAGPIGSQALAEARARLAAMDGESVRLAPFFFFFT
jgi:hypothetical protein